MASPLVHAAITEVRRALSGLPKDRALLPKMFANARRDLEDVLKEYGDTDPEGASERRAALRAVYISMPAPVCQTLLQHPGSIESYEALLAEELRTASVTDAARLPRTADGLSVWQGDMSRLRADAVVNPGNNALLGCFLPSHKCLDNILHGAAGPRLRIACSDLLSDLGLEEDTNGQCRVTPAFLMPSRHVFHTVGPCLFDHNPPRKRDAELRAPTKRDQDELRSCYVRCLQTAEEMGLRSLAFCCISTGIFGYPAEDAAELAIRTVLEHQHAVAQQHGRDKALHVIFNVFKDEDLDIYNKLVPLLSSSMKKADDGAQSA
jgi:O-acetyl-ADP-ribose deacetylase (regulator of RNase III)